MKAIWADYNIKMNTTVAFSLDLKDKKNAKITLAGASLYRLYADGKFIFFGPQRAAKGYAREISFDINARYITVEVESIYIETFWVIKQEPFFACEVTTSDGEKYTSDDFESVLELTEYNCRIITENSSFDVINTNLVNEHLYESSNSFNVIVKADTIENMELDYWVINGEIYSVDGNIVTTTNIDLTVDSKMVVCAVF
jgi:hypothetical protein